jgi:transcription termination factor Rho
MEGLAVIAERFGVAADGALSKGELIFRLLEAQSRTEGYLFASGVFEASGSSGFGFLRRRDATFDQTDVYVSTAQVGALGLRNGDIVAASVRVPLEDERYLSLVRVEAVNGLDPAIAKKRPG